MNKATKDAIFGELNMAATNARNKPARDLLNAISHSLSREIRKMEAERRALRSAIEFAIRAFMPGDDWVSVPVRTAADLALNFGKLKKLARVKRECGLLKSAASAKSPKRSNHLALAGATQTDCSIVASNALKNTAANERP